MSNLKCWAIVPAAGSGSRFGGTTPKQYIDLEGIPIIVRAVNALIKVEEISGIAVGISPDDKWWAKCAINDRRVIGAFLGGACRAETVLRGLEYLESSASADDWVLVHDAARPCIRIEDIKRVIAMRSNGSGGALLGTPISETVKYANQDNLVEKTIPRSNLWLAQTPQIFPYRLLYDALVKSDLETVTDESSAIEAIGYRPYVIHGDSFNIKITTNRDLKIASLIMQYQSASHLA
ncbi:MAG: 2-C-methyl-D-erythritol 4-phosphate cytidylyltransferase [Acidiferrobacteraceae bacterium]|nr:2-C-methyl-D-erythritol 4-phosphate cytidylyltransferase [Acidiferrobacteraceae bacterium]|tara:strand:- start:867 stop:1574 length:708 start_codon:yes stop_codon:yes gene_type:complete